MAPVLDSLLERRSPVAGPQGVEAELATRVWVLFGSSPLCLEWTCGGHNPLVTVAKPHSDLQLPSTTGTKNLAGCVKSYQGLGGRGAYERD